MQASNTLSGLQGNLTLMLPVVLLSLFVGVIGGIYIAEWLPKTNWIRRVVEGKVAIFAGMPSLLYGLLALEVFVFRYVGFAVQALAFVLLVMISQFRRRSRQCSAWPCRSGKRRMHSVRTDGAYWQTTSSPSLCRVSLQGAVGPCHAHSLWQDCSSACMHACKAR